MVTDSRPLHRLRLAVRRISYSLPHPIANPASVRMAYRELPEGVQAYYSALTNTIRINESFRAGIEAGLVDQLVGVLAHELHHTWQWRNQRLRYITGKLWRPLIERSADEVEDAADRLAGNGGLLSGDEL